MLPPPAWQLAALVLLALAVRALAGVTPIDDAYITFRYARNLVEGHGLVFNPGERVLGTTAPLWALLLAAGHLLTTLSIPTVAALLAAAAGVGSVLLVATLVREATGSPVWSLAAACALALSPFEATFSASGMETSFFTFLLLATYRLRERAMLWPLVAAAATLTRPEGSLLAAVLLLHRPRMALRSAAVYGACLIPWAAAGVLYYGSFVPQSMLAKTAPIYFVHPGLMQHLLIAETLGLPLAGFGRLYEWLNPPLAALVTDRAIALTLLSIALLLIAGEVIRRRAKLALPLVGYLFPLAFLAFHFVGASRGGLRFPWYLVPALPWLLMWLAIYGDALCRRLKLPRLVPAVLAGGLVLAQIPGWNIDAQPLRSMTWPRTAKVWMTDAGLPLGREDLYLEVAKHLQAKAAPGSSVACPEIGAIGWAAPELRILDTVGLVTPQAVGHYPLIDEAAYGPSNAVPGSFIRAERPDYILAMEAFLRPVLQRERRVLEDYVVDLVVPSHVFGSRGLLLLRRADVTEPGRAVGPLP